MSTPAEVLRLDPEQISRNADFLETYANTLLPSGAEFGERSWPSDVEDSIRREEVATALQQAAQWRSLLDVSLARSLFVRAGRHYWAIGRPFGLFLLTAWWEDEDALRDATYEAVNVWIENEDDSAHGRMIKASLQHPQQQAYLMLACAGNRRIASRLQGLSEHKADSAAVRSGAPMGPAGTPTHLRWALASSLMETAGIGAAVEALAETAGRYHSAIRTASVNTYLWTHGASPVDVMDVDLAGTASLFALRFDQKFVVPIIDATASSESNYLARVPLEIGLALARETVAAREALDRERAQLAADEELQREESNRRAAQTRQEEERRERERRDAERRDEDGGSQSYFTQE